MALPIWVTEDLLTKTLQEHFRDNTLTLVEVSSKAAVPVGDNYTSDMFRATVLYKTSSSNIEAKTISLIVKCCADGGPKELLAKEIGLFEKESSMFNNIIPLIHETLNDKNNGNHCYLASGCLFAQDKPKGLLILQDLSTIGFVMGDRRNGLDLEHCKLVLNRIAKFHAASAIIYKKDPKIMSNYDKGIYTNQQNNQVIEHFIMSGFKSLIAAIDKWPGFENYAEKLKKIQPTLFDNSVSVAARKENGFNVLNHGDMWTNNMLFRYEQDGKPVDLRFVDFQMSVFASPAIDLQYFMHTSPSLHVYVSHFNNLLKHYHSSLVECLKALKYPLSEIPSLEQITDDFRARSFYGLVSAATVLPLVRAPKREDATYDDLINDDDSEGGIRYASYHCEGYKQTMQYFLPLFDKQGLLG